MNTVYNKNTYFEKLNEFYATLRNAAYANAILVRLDFYGVPKGSVIFSSPRKKYINASGEEIEYQYTNSYLYIDGIKYYVSKKALHRNTKFSYRSNDPSVQANRLILQNYLFLRMKAENTVQFHLKEAKKICNFLNANKEKCLPRIFFKHVKDEIFSDFLESEENNALIDWIDNIFVEQSICSPTIADKNTLLELELCFRSESDSETKYRIKSDKIRRKYKPDLIVKNSHKLDIKDFFKSEISEIHPDFNSFFANEIFNESGERQRSKNEVIAARCMHDCGLSYEVEPLYPYSNKMADFKVQLENRIVYIEIAGMRNDPKYEINLQEKRILAKKYNIPLVIIDMTAYPDENGIPQTRFNYKALSLIFQYIRLGILIEGIVFPY